MNSIKTHKKNTKKQGIENNFKKLTFSKLRFLSRWAVLDSRLLFSLLNNCFLSTRKKWPISFDKERNVAKSATQPNVNSTKNNE
jgi:hypothetical protein